MNLSSKIGGFNVVYNVYILFCRLHFFVCQIYLVTKVIFVLKLVVWIMYVGVKVFCNMIHNRIMSLSEMNVNVDFEYIHITFELINLSFWAITQFLPHHQMWWITDMDVQVTIFSFIINCKIILIILSYLGFSYVINA